MILNCLKILLRNRIKQGGKYDTKNKSKHNIISVCFIYNCINFNIDMTESQLQHQLIMWFSQSYPQFNGLLFEVNNDTYNVNHAQHRRAMGMVRGVSDLLLVSPHTGVITAIELKAPGSKHKTEHIKRQLEWGETVINAGGNYIMSSDLYTLQTVIKMIVEENRHISINKIFNHLKEIVDNTDKKTINF